MKERPILFSGEMVRAILDGRKTQTRRVIKKVDQNCDGLKLMGKNDYAMTWNKNPEIEKYLIPKGGLLEIAHIHCHFGQPGDRLWVRETWRPIRHLQRTEETYIRFKADNGLLPVNHKLEMDMDVPIKWRPSIFMPRWASRILLEVVSVRVERVRDISEDDAIAEGVERLYSQKICDSTAGLIGTKAEDHGYKNYLWHGEFKNQVPPVDWQYQYSNYTKARLSFSSLWELINGKKYPWDTNPWVWVIEFKVLEVNHAG
jgi:hypothetical protein